jgi:hypothetical protein
VSHPSQQRPRLPSPTVRSPPMPEIPSSLLLINLPRSVPGKLPNSRTFRSVFCLCFTLFSLFLVGWLISYSGSLL